MNKPIQIGYINAHIAGDWRYSSNISVTTDGTNATVTLSESGAAGGMDGPGGSTPMAVTRTLVCKAEPSELVKAIKRVINEENGTTIKTYGKPSKRFVWVGLDCRGLSVKLATEALKQ